ncbi:hypothetical protein VBM87_00010 [Mycoplasma sp. 744]|uniref:MAG3240 family lipoprotein n=1 Tax=Mycoplasma sp. 744 TaxID=3108531 RepID=UPI002B1DCE52|nr:hypothetical protein [Mycoplasma sp. 744]MEA4115177.1 hypothetical protein [Mycoplasma sp. 744]
MKKIKKFLSILTPFSLFLTIACQENNLVHIKIKEYLKELKFEDNLTFEQIKLYLQINLKELFDYQIKKITYTNKQINIDDLFVYEYDFVEPKKFIIDNNNYLLNSTNKHTLKLNDLFLFNWNPEILTFNNYLNNLWTEHNSNNYSSLDLILPNIQYLIYIASINNPLNFKNKISITKLRPSAFILNKEQHFYLLKTLEFYIKYFEIDSLSKNFYLDFGILNKINENLLQISLIIFDENNKLIFKSDNKIYITNFIDYSQLFSRYVNKISGEILSLNINEHDDISNIQLNEKFNDINLIFENNIFNIIDFDSLLHPNEIYKEVNFNVLKYLFNELKENIKIITNGQINNNLIIDRLEDTNLLNNTYAIAKLIVFDKIEKKYYPWYSVNFTSHHHLLNGFYIKNELNLLNNKNSENYFGYQTYQSNQKIKFVNPDIFFENNLIFILNFLIKKNMFNSQLWNSQNMNKLSNIEIVHKKDIYEKRISNLISQFVLLYAINNGSLIKEVKVSIDPDNDFSFKNYPLGIIPMKIDFIDDKNQSMLNSNNKDNLFYLKGFKGFEFSFDDISENEINIQPLENQELIFIERII